MSTNDRDDVLAFKDMVERITPAHLMVLTKGELRELVSGLEEVHRVARAQLIVLDARAATAEPEGVLRDLRGGRTDV